MEVHHHSHSSPASGGTPRKKWTHYFWEFLMLFLAVFCGFLAENQREHYVEHQRAKRFAKSLIEDLQADTAEMHLCNTHINLFFAETDSFFAELRKPRNQQNDTTLQILGADHIYNFNFFDPTMGNYEQIKNSGALRYFKQSLIKKMTTYENGKNKLVQGKQNYIELLNTVIAPFCVQLGNADFLEGPGSGMTFRGPSLFISEPGKEILNQWKNYMHLLRRIQADHKWAIERHEKRALELMNELKEEYNLE